MIAKLTVISIFEILNEQAELGYLTRAVELHLGACACGADGPQLCISGLDVLAIGGGIASLGFTIEAYRKDHYVTLIKRRPNFNSYNMILPFSSCVSSIAISERNFH